MTDRSFWFITVFEKTDNEDLGECRCPGFFTDRQDALDALHKNALDIYECFFEYAVLEAYHEGIHDLTENRQFFKFDKGKGGYTEIAEPAFFKQFIHIGPVG